MYRQWMPVCFVRTFLERNKYKSEMRDHHKRMEICLISVETFSKFKLIANKTIVTITKLGVGPSGGVRFATGGRWPFSLISPRNPCSPLPLPSTTTSTSIVRHGSANNNRKFFLKNFGPVWLPYSEGCRPGLTRLGFTELNDNNNIVLHYILYTVCS